jgi:serine/threonine protein kinase
MTTTGMNGTKYNLNPTPIGSGGEGDIYAVHGMDYVAKIYKTGVLTSELERKLKVMIENPPNASVLSQVAWPLDLISDDNGKCCGFVMPKLSINAELGEVYKYPATLPISSHQKLNIAQNICVVISEVHKAGYVFGDFNPRNIGLDVNTGLVSFLDTDTYHVADENMVFRCNVCAPGYAAPELLEKCSEYVGANPGASKNAYALTPLPTFTQETDNFALAIHIFKLLMNGYTPFGGIIETASVSQSSPGVGDAAVRRNSYCFRPGYKAQSVAIPALEALSGELADLFTRAFIEGRVAPQKRPTAVEWHNALSKYEQQLVTCPNNPMHHYDKKNTKCPLCEADEKFSEALGVSAKPAASQLKQAAYATPPSAPPITTQTQHQQSPTYGYNQPHSPTHTPTSVKTSLLKFAIAFAASFLVAVLISLHSALPYGLGGLIGAQAPASIIYNVDDTNAFDGLVHYGTGIAVGDIIPFGMHDWRVLDIDGNYALILTDMIISSRAYNYPQSNVTWATSGIRQYLNNEFYNNFSTADRTRIRETYVINNDNPWTFSMLGRPNQTLGGDNTIDKIFLLSLEELTLYFGDSELLELGKNESNRDGSITYLYSWGILGQTLQHTPEDNEIRQRRIAYSYDGTVSWWWLRSPGSHSGSAAHVIGSHIQVHGNMGVSMSGGVRPALWLNLES